MSANELPNKSETAGWLILPAARTVISPTGAEFNFSWGNDAWLLKAGTGKAREPALRQTARHLWEDAIAAGPRALISKATIAYGTTEWFPSPCR